MVNELSPINNKRKSADIFNINKKGLIYHATYFNDFTNIIENGLTIDHPNVNSKMDSRLPSGANVTLIGTGMVSIVTYPIRRRADFKLDKGRGVVFLGELANMHIDPKYKKDHSDERVAFSLFEVPKDKEVYFYNFEFSKLECGPVSGEILSEVSIGQYNQDMTGMILTRPDLSIDWLKGFVIPPNCYVKRYGIEHIDNNIKERTLGHFDLDDPRVTHLENNDIILPEDMLVERIISCMETELSDKNQRKPLYSVDGKCIYNPY